MLTLCFPINVWALQSNVPSEQEMRLLPPYCEAKVGKQRGNPEAKQYWSNIFGAANWKHMHHYCEGLNWLNRANRVFGDKQTQAYNLNNAINNFNYMLTHTERNFSLRPEILVNKGKALVLMKRGGEAAAEFSKAIAFKADYAPAYISLGDYYLDAGNKKKARATYEDGLKLNPGFKALQRRLDDIK